MYEYLESLAEMADLPIVGTNVEGEHVVIEDGASGDRHFYRVTTAQHNGWLRINTYWDDGDTEETYKR